MRPFEIVLIGFFIVAAIGSLIFITFYKGRGGENERPYGERVIVWGTLDGIEFSKIVSEMSSKDPGFNAVRYEQKDPLTFDTELVNAIADGAAPDLVILPHEKLVTFRSKLLPISYDTISERSFRDTYVDGAEIFMRPDGVYGIPLGVDPLVLYWNRDVFSSSGLANPPSTWEQLVNETTVAITRKDVMFNISKSAISLGEYSNISHPKQIFAMLLLQAGTNIVEERETTYKVTLNDAKVAGLQPGNATLSFYTQFSNPTNNNYTWNRSLKEDRLMFLGGDLGMYIGFGSEYDDLQKANPNLNFDVAAVPQGSGATILRNYGDFYAFVIPRTSKNQAGAYSVATILGSEKVVSRLIDAWSLGPVHRSLIAAGSPNPFRHLIYQSGLISRGWLDPNPQETDQVFKQMIEDITSGRERVTIAVNDTITRLNLLFK